MIATPNASYKTPNTKSSQHDCQSRCQGAPSLLMIVSLLMVASPTILRTSCLTPFMLLCRSFYKNIPIANPVCPPLYTWQLAAPRMEIICLLILQLSIIIIIINDDSSYTIIIISIYSIIFITCASWQCCVGGRGGRGARSAAGRRREAGGQLPAASSVSVCLELVCAFVFV